MAGDVQELTDMRTPFHLDRSVVLSVDDDTSLVDAARRDTAAFAALYWRYVTPIYRYVYSRVGGEADAQDLTAQVFLEALEGLPRYRDRGNFAAWLFTIARRRAIDHHRRRPVLLLDDAPEPATDEDPQSQMLERETLERLKTLVTQLSDDQQELLRLRFAAGLTFNQMGAVLGRSEAAVKMALRRLLDNLKAKWEVHDEHTA